MLKIQSESALHWLEAAGNELDEEVFEKRRTEARQDLVSFGAKTSALNSRGVRPDDIRAMWPHEKIRHFDPHQWSEGKT